MRAHVVVGDDHVLGSALGEIARSLAGRGIEITRIPASPVPRLLRCEPATDVDVVVISSRTVLDARAMRDARQLRGVVFPSVGTGSCDLRAATELGVVVANGATPENTGSMAEATVMLILALLYELPRKQARFREPWTGSADPVTSRMLRGRTVGLIGFGNISKQTVRLLDGWGVGRFLAHTRRPPEREWPQVEFVGLAALLESSDIVVVYLPYTPETRGLLGRERLARMRPGALFVNASRGGIVDEDGLADLLRAGHIAGAAVDTFASEPLPMEAALRRAPNAILTKHVVGHTVEMFDSVAGLAVENVLALIEGREPRAVVNPECLTTWRKRFQPDDPATTPVSTAHFEE